jgi:hypothetical protein
MNYAAEMCSGLAQDKDQRRALVNMEMHLRVL